MAGQLESADFDRSCRFFSHGMGAADDLSLRLLLTEQPQGHPTGILHISRAVCGLAVFSEAWAGWGVPPEHLRQLVNTFAKGCIPKLKVPISPSTFSGGGLSRTWC